MVWYIRNENGVIGPFPAGHVQQSILLGRIALDDDASQDKQDWLPVRRCAELIPDVLKLDRSVENREERIQAAKRWADERRHERREGEDPVRTSAGRRDEEPPEAMEYRHQREAGFKATRLRRERNFQGLIIVVILILAGVAAGFLFPAAEPVAAQCHAPAAAKINWMDCQLVGLQSLNSDLNGAVMANGNFESANLVGSSIDQANLSYVNLSKANLSFVSLKQTRLIGADLRYADLSNANFQGADLSYANLTGAIMRNTDLDGALLKNAIWTDGKTCLPGSVGQCLTP